MDWSAKARAWTSEKRPRAEIVTAENPARMARLAAAELQSGIEKISGARLPIVTEPSIETVRIYVGVSPHTERLGLDTDGLKYGAYRIASGPDWLALLGPDRDFEPVEPWGRGRSFHLRNRLNQAWDEITGETFTSPFHSTFMYYQPDLDVWAFDDRGTLHAVYAFLHDLGMRWYWPGELGEVVPKQADIALPETNRVVRPDFAVRRLWWFYPHQGISEEDALWRLRLGLHEGHDVHGITQPVHGMKYVHGREEFRQAHPDAFALWGGERATGHKSVGAPCLSSGEMFEKHLAYARAVFDHYGEPTLSVDPVDGYGFMCGCEACRGLETPERDHAGRMSDYVWGYINRLAQELYQTHPDRMVSGAAYSGYRLPPENIGRLSPNLMVRIGMPRMSLHDPRVREESERLVQAWLEKLPSGKVITTGNIYFNWPSSPWARLPVYYPRQIAENLRALRGVSLGESLECYEHPPARREAFDWDAQAVAHLAIYGHARLWWDVDLDIDALLDEYYTGFYGPAAGEMKAFIEYSEANWPNMVSPPGRTASRVTGARGDAGVIGHALDLLAAAQAAADPETVYGRRVRRVAEYLRPMHDLRAQLERASAREDVPRQRLLPQPALAGRPPDGRLDDERYWPPGRRVLPLRELETGRPAPAGLGTRFQVFWAGNAVHFGIRCSEPDIAQLNLGADRDGDVDIRAGDFVEILLETQTHSWYRITITSGRSAA